MYSWLPGENAATAPVTDPEQMTLDLARFLKALHRIDATRGPDPGAHNFGRRVPLADRDASIRAAIEALPADIDAEAVTTAWEAALQVPPFRDGAVWIHGDLSPGNLLIQHGRLTSVIDFGGLGVGDPACDLIIAWSMMSNKMREVFRRALAVDDAPWFRGRGWALSVAVIYIPYYERTNPTEVAAARRVVDEILAEQASA